MASAPESPLLFDPDDRGRRRWVGDLAFVGAVGALFALLVLEIAPQLLQGALLDTDSYMRLVRVRQLAESGAWYDGMIPRSNAPFGETLHWTRPVDVLVLIGGWLLTPFVGFERALHAAGVFLSPALLVATCLAVAWTVTPLVGPGMRYYAMIGVLAQVGVMSYALPGRADHHMLILFVFVMTIGTVIRLLLGPPDARAGLVTGIWAGLGLWISTEFLLLIAVLLGAGTILWVLEGGDWAKRLLWISIGLSICLSGALLVERPAHDLATIEFDRLSLVHLWVGIAATMFWALIIWIDRRDPTGKHDERRGLSRNRRAVATAVAGILAFGLTQLFFPGFFWGPMVAVDPELERLWLPYVTEHQPFLIPHQWTDIGKIIAYLGPALLAMPVALWWLARDRGSRIAAVWLFVVVALAGFLPASLRWVRFVPYAEALGLIVLIVILDGALRRIDARARGVPRTLLRVGLSAGLLAGFLLVGGAIMAMGGQAGSAARDLGETQIAACNSGPLMTLLADSSGLGARPKTIVAHVDLGPEILYRTPHSVLATPYHRNASGLLTGRQILASRDDSESRRLVVDRGVDLILVCGAGTAAPFFGGTEAPITLYGKLVTGAPPNWLTPVSIPEGAAGGFVVYRL